MSIAIHIKKNLILSFLLIGVSMSILLIVDSKFAAATSTAGFQAGRIIDDPVFINKNTMDVGQIQTFLNSKVSSCDTNGTLPASEYGRSDLTHAQYAAMVGWPAPPYTCLKDYSVNSVSAAQIIYNTAQKYSINPQVFIVLLQKEQGLITDTWPLSTQYRTATGYGCPDTAPCDSQYYGLVNQLDWSGKMFRAIMDNVPQDQWYTPYILGNNYIQYNPDSSCGGSTVNIQNRATQALYNYTPYQPNQAALDAGYGSAPCGAYGNRNFYLYFTDWFGSTVGPDYAWTINSVGLYADSQYTQSVPISNGNYFLQPNQKVYVKVIGENIGRATWQYSNTRLGTYSPYDYSSPFADGSWNAKNRIVHTDEQTVKPNDTATFEFTITAPSTRDNYTENYSVVVENIAWVNNTHIKIPIVVTNPVAAPVSTASTLESGATLNRGQSIISPEKHSVLKLQNNGNLELYTNFVKVWETKTAGSGATRLLDQSDGNLVLYGPNGAVWSSGTASAGPAKLMLQSDGNLVLYGPNGAVWGSGTSTYNQTSIINEQMKQNNLLMTGQSITTPDRKYTLVLQDDGNLVLYSPTKALWGSGTNGKKAASLIMQSDGNLVLYDDTGYPIWASGTYGNGASNLVMQSDGNLVLYSPTRATWASNTYQG